MRKNYFIEGLPLSKRVKFTTTAILIGLLIINITILGFFDLKYPGGEWVNLGLVILSIIFSIGGIGAELLVIGVGLFALFSNIWDAKVYDLSLLRIRIFIGTIAVLVIETALGKVSLTNAFSVLKGQFGVNKKGFGRR